MSSNCLVCLFANGQSPARIRVSESHLFSRRKIYQELATERWTNLPINPVQNSKGAESLISTQPFRVISSFAAEIDLGG
jgi:hypothetical protein